MGYNITIQGDVKDKLMIDKIVMQLKAIIPQLVQSRVSINTQITRVPQINAK